MSLSILGEASFQIIETPKDTLFSGDSTQFKIQYSPNGNSSTAHVSISSNAKTDMV